MKRIAIVIENLRNAVRELKFLPRTIITATAAFAFVLAFSIVFELTYNFLASHSWMLITAGIVGGQVFLYWKDLSCIKIGLLRLAADPTSIPVQGQTQARQKITAPVKEKTGFASFTQSMAQAFASPSDEDVEEEELFED